MKAPYATPVLVTSGDVVREEGGLSGQDGLRQIEGQRAASASIFKHY